MTSSTFAAMSAAFLMTSALLACSTTPSTPDAATEAGPDVEVSDAAVVGCFTLNAAAQTCSYSSTACNMVNCVGDAATLGTCPATGLYGCCITKGTCGLAIGATCYYNAEAGLPAAQSCEYEGYGGFPMAWQTAPP